MSSVSLDWWAQYYAGGSYFYLTSVGIDKDLFWATRDAVGYSSTDIERRGTPEGESPYFKVTYLGKEFSVPGVPNSWPKVGRYSSPRVDLYVKFEPQVDKQAQRGFVFIHCFVAPKGLNLDIKTLPFIDNDKAIELAKQYPAVSGQHPPPVVVQV